MALQPVTGFRYAPTRGCRVEFAAYAEGGLAITLWDDDEPQATATVNLAPYGSRPLAPDEVWLKGWSENQGIPEALEAAGYLTLTGEVTINDFVTAELGRLTPEAMEAARAAGFGG